MANYQLHSMTGFASAEGQLAGVPIRVELKSLNHRFLDLKLRIPRELVSLEQKIRGLIQEHFSRGSFELKLERVQGAGQPAPVELNQPLAASYVEKMKLLQAEHKLAGELSARELALFPDVLSQAPLAWSKLDDDQRWEELKPVFTTAIKQNQAMRKTEGQAISSHFEKLIGELRSETTQIQGQRETWEKVSHDKLTRRMKEIFANYPLAEGSVKEVLESRIAQELATLLDRTDIAEELTRLAAHLDHLEKILGQKGAVGRKVDFVLQELNREINTLGNKAQDYGISESVVQIKVKLEQLREQAMNVE